MSGRHSLQHESHLDRPPGQADPSHSVWAEPQLAAAGRNPWATMWEAGERRWSAARSALLLALLMLLSGPLGVATSLLITLSDGLQSAVRVLAVVVLAPTVEEIAKVLGPLLLVELRPWCVRSGTLLLVAGLCGGLCFAVIENYWYLQVLIPDPSAELVLWRWTVCVALHGTCSSIVGLGLMRAWRRARATRRRGDVQDIMPAAIVAMLIHGGYNAVAMFLEF